MNVLRGSETTVKMRHFWKNWHTPFALSPVLDGCCSTNSSTLSSSPNIMLPKRGLRTLLPAVFLRPINNASIDSSRVPLPYKKKFISIALFHKVPKVKKLIAILLYSYKFLHGMQNLLFTLGQAGHKLPSSRSLLVTANFNMASLWR